jgi:hypothetical protein
MTYISPFDRAGDDQDGQRRADEHSVAQQAQVDQGRPNTPFDEDEGHPRDGREAETGQRGG